MVSDDEHVVLRFRPRTSAHPPGKREEPEASAQHAANDLSGYEQPRDEPDDFRHRMLANVAALAFTVALMAWAVVPFDVGVVLSDSNVGLLYILAISSLGLRNCARISVTPPG